MIGTILILVGILGFTLAMLEWGPKVTFGEGWLIPHSEPVENCRVNCATCKGVRE